MLSGGLAVLLAVGFGVLRGLMLVAYAFALIFKPEKVKPGSTTEPARSFALMAASRTMVLGVALLALALTGRHEGLALTLVADAALQVFDAGLAIKMKRGATAAAPAVIGVVEALLAVVLLR
jgi:hypothetical protein